MFEKIRQIHLQEMLMLMNPYEKYKVRHDQDRIKKSFGVGDRIWSQMKKEIPQVFVKNIKALWYGPFDILEKVTHNSYKSRLTP